MKLFEEVIERVTQRFDVDPELRAELAMELRSHLEESAVAFEAAGAPPEEAAAKAVNAIGDEADLAQQLWSANVRRLRLRGLLHWVGRVTLIPAAIVLVVFLLPPNLIRILVLQDSMKVTGSRTEPHHETEIDELLAAGVLPMLMARGDAGASIDEAQMLRERVAAIHGPESPEAHLLDPRDIDLGRRVLDARADQLAALRDHESYPTLHALHASEVVQLYLSHTQSERKGQQWTHPPPDAAAMLELIAAGESLEPDRALYNLLRAAIHMEQATRWDAETQTLSLTEVPALDQALKQIELAINRGLEVEPSLQFSRLQLQTLPGIRSVEDVLIRRAFSISTLLPRLTVVPRLGDSLLLLAAQRAERGDEAGAEAALHLAEKLAHETAASARLVIELLIARGMKTRVLEQRLAMHRAAGELDAAEQLKAQLHQLEGTFALARKQWQEIAEARAENVPLVARRANLAPHLPGPQLHALRRAEYLLMDRAALSILAGLLLIVLLIRCLLVSIARWRAESSALTLVHIPLPRLMRLLLLALIVPLTLYALYAWSPLGMRGYGLAVASEPTALEYTLMGCIMLTLLRIGTWNEIARRSRQLGLGQWPILTWFPRWRTRRRLMPLVVGTMGGAIAYLMTWRIGGSESMPQGVGYAISIAIIAVTLTWWAADRADLRRRMKLPAAPGIWHRLVLVVISLLLVMAVGQPWSARDDMATYAVGTMVLWLWLLGEFFIQFWHAVKLPSLRLYHRSTVPVIAAVLLTVTAMTGAVLRQAEARAASEIQPEVDRELEQSPYAQVDLDA